MAPLVAQIGTDWLGAHPTGRIEIAPAPPFWQGQGAMITERQVATGIIRSWWPRQLADIHAHRIVDGFASYLQGVAIEQLFDRRYQRRAYRTESIPYLGGHVVWSFPPLRLTRQPERSDPYAAVFTTLERWLGQPSLQAAMQAVSQLARDRITGTAIITTISSAVGQELNWLFIPAADPALAVDYAVTDLSSSPGACSLPCFDTTVTVARLGDGQVTGRSTPRLGSFESGDALALRVSFANGDQAWARWDGRDASRAFRFQGPAAATAAHLDPDRVVVLDQNVLNNAVVRPAPTNVPVRKWMARWIVWMQNTMLTYGFFG